jgi:hypothetical protein
MQPMSTDSSQTPGRFDCPASLPDGSALVLRVMASLSRLAWRR